MIQTMIRKTLLRMKHPVIFNDSVREIPISKLFGYDRGKPIDRYYIERFLERNANLISGDVLEVGDNSYTKQFGGNRVIRSCVINASEHQNCDVIEADLTDCNTLPVNSFDCFICTQTLNFIFNVQHAVMGAKHLLKPGGIFLGTVAGISQISRYDMDRWGDYWRFTTASMKKILEPVFDDYLQVECHGNCLAACALLQGVAVEDLPDVALLDNLDPDYQVVITIFARKSI
jgi:SAM-dependent methyltransferase